MTDLQKIVNILLERAVRVHDSTDALRLTQAALNAAHTLHAMEPRNPTP
jgi:hypothetical protein